MRYILLIYLLAIVIDYAIGVSMAFVNGKLKSRKMRDGIIRKLCEFVYAMTLCIASKFVPTEYLGLADATVYIFVGKMILAEFTSIQENLKKKGSEEE